MIAMPIFYGRGRVAAAIESLHRDLGARTQALWRCAVRCMPQSVTSTHHRAACHVQPKHSLHRFSARLRVTRLAPDLRQVVDESGVGLGVPANSFGDRPPMVVESRPPHEEAEVTGVDQFTRNVLGRSRHQVGECPDLLGRRDVVLGARQQEDRATDRRQIHLRAVDQKNAAGQFVVNEQVLDDPQVEGAGKVGVHSNQLVKSMCRAT